MNMRKGALLGFTIKQIGLLIQFILEMPVPL